MQGTHACFHPGGGATSGGRGTVLPALGVPAEPKQAAPLLWAPNASVDLSSSAPAFLV